MTRQNTIVLEKSGEIIIQDAENGQVNLDVHNIASTSEQLCGLSEAQIDSLLQILEERPEWPHSFGVELKRVAKEKNVVKGGISHIKGNVIIGDGNKTIYNYYSKISEYEQYQHDLKKFNHNQQRQTLEPVEEVNISDLDPRTLENLMKQERVIKHLALNKPRGNELVHQLERLDLIIDNHKMVKGVCLSLCSDHKIRSLSHTAIPSKFVVYSDPDGLGIRAIEQLSGNLLSQYERAVELLIQYLELTRNIRADKDDFEVPRVVFRELLANAFIHSDYSYKRHAVNIKIELFPDRLVITNPGYFHEDIDPNRPETIHNSMIINPDIAKVFFLCGIVETVGKGIARVKSVLNMEGLEPAVYRQEKGCVKVTVFKKKPKPNRLLGEEVINYAKELTMELPKTHPDDTVGVEGDLKEVYELLNRRKIVLITGMAGMGKTTLARTYITKYYDDYKHIVWIDSQSGDVRKSFAEVPGLARNLHINKDSTPEEALFEEIIIKMKNLNASPNLLVIDDADVSITSYLSVLPSAPHWHLLATSRKEVLGFHVWQLKPLSEISALNLFKKHYTHGALNEPDILTLIRTMGYHALAIEILAKAAALQRYQADILKHAIEEDLRAGIMIRKDDKVLKIEKIGTYLRSLFDLNQLNENELWLMKQFVCLPAESHSYELLKALVTSPESEYAVLLSETLQSVVFKGWLLEYKENDCYRMHPIIAAIIKQDQVISIQDVKTLIKNLTQRLSVDKRRKDNVADKFIWIPYVQTLLSNFENSDAKEIKELKLKLTLINHSFNQGKNVMTITGQEDSYLRHKAMLEVYQYHLLCERSSRLEHIARIARQSYINRDEAWDWLTQSHTIELFRREFKRNNVEQYLLEKKAECYSSLKVDFRSINTMSVDEIDSGFKIEESRFKVIVELLSAGYTYKEIAKCLNMAGDDLKDDPETFYKIISELHEP